MAEKFIMLNLDDEKISRVSEVIGSKICKKILKELVEENLSEGDLSKKLGIPLNTLEYNLKKLTEVGLVEKTKDFFWSKRGKKIPTYRAVRKSIIIQPKSKTWKSFLIVGIISLIMALGIKSFFNTNLKERYIYDTGSEIISDVVSIAPEVIVEKSSDLSNILFHSTNSPELWFLAGSLIALLLIIIFNWRRI